MSEMHVTGLVVNRVGQPVVRGVDLSVRSGEVTALLGANGVGKSTLLDGLSGVAPVAAGEIMLDGTALTRLSRTKRVAAGLVYVQQGRAIFPSLTVEENFVVTAPRREMGQALEMFPELEKRLNSPAALLSGGEQQMVVLGRALLQKPKVLMLDELSLGLAPIIVDRMLAAVRHLTDQGLAVLLVEQFATKALAIADSALVMSRGEIVYDGDAATLSAEPEILQNAYLGKTVA